MAPLLAAAILALVASACGEPIGPAASGAEIDPSTNRVVEEAGYAGSRPRFSVSGESGADVLVFGDYVNAREILSAELAALGRNVTTTVALPADLSEFEVIWQTSTLQVLSESDRARLALFLRDGGGLHLNGERRCCEALNTSVQTFVNSVVQGGAVSLGRRGDFEEGIVVNPAAAGGVTSRPHVVTSYKPIASGAMTGVSGANLLGSAPGGLAIGGVWESGSLVGGAGRLTLLMDVNWYGNAMGEADNRKLLENIQCFLEGSDCTPPTIAAAVTGTMGNGGWYTSDVSVTWTVADAESPVTASSGCGAASVTADGYTHILCSATSAGGTGVDSVLIRRDATLPGIVYGGNAGIYSVDQTVAITCTATDATSGIASSDCAGVNRPAYLLTLGLNTLTASATDAAGNTASVSASFTVVVTDGGLCALTRSFVSQAGVAHAMCVKVQQGALNAYLRQVAAQAGKTVSHDNAAILTRLALAMQSQAR